jgi:DNA-binding transcriptional ArsR family regulator
MPKERLHPEEFRLVANAIANGDRYKILHQIYSRLAVSIGQIAGELEMSSARVSRHVRRLERARLVQRVRRFQLFGDRIVSGNAPIFHVVNCENLHWSTYSSPQASVSERYQLPKPSLGGGEIHCA